MTTYTTAQIETLGANAWTPRNGGQTRHYLNTWTEMIGLDITRYNTGNIRWASLAGETISNSKAQKIFNGKAYIADGVLYTVDIDDAVRAQLVAAITARITPAALATRTTREAAAALGVSVRTVQRRAAAGQLDAVKVAGRWIITL